MTLDFSENDNGPVSPPPIKKDDTLHGDRVQSENVSYSNISAYSGVAIGRDQQNAISQTGAPASLARQIDALFNNLHYQVRTARDPGYDPAAADEMLTLVQYEVSKGPQASTNLLERWLLQMSQMMPDITRQLTDGLSEMDLPPAVTGALHLGGMEAAAAAPPQAPATPHAAVLSEIENSPLPPPEKEALLDQVNLIQREIEKAAMTKGGHADARKVQGALESLLSSGRQLPRLPRLLFSWLVEGPGVPTSLRIIAKGMIR